MSNQEEKNIEDLNNFEYYNNMTLLQNDMYKGAEYAFFLTRLGKFDKNVLYSEQGIKLWLS